MIEGSVEGVTGLLEAISDWGRVAGKELGEALGNPSNVPIFLSSLVKFSLGPFLAFGLSFLAFRWQEKRKDRKVSESTRAMIILENLYNLNEMRKMEDNLSRIEGKTDLPPNLEPEIFLEFFQKSLLALEDFAEKEQLRSLFFSKVEPSLLTQSLDPHELLCVYNLYNNIYPNLIESIKKAVKRCSSAMVLDDIQDLKKVISEIKKDEKATELDARKLEELENLHDELNNSKDESEASRKNLKKVIKIMCETLEIDLRNDHDIDLILGLTLKLFDEEEDISGGEAMDRMAGLMFKFRDGEIELSNLETAGLNRGSSVNLEQDHVNLGQDYQKLQKMRSDLKALMLQYAKTTKKALTKKVKVWIIKDISKEIRNTRDWVSAICTILARSSTKELRALVDEECSK